ncbi:uncharacterized protein LOC144335799 [Macaca mulatta]
MVPSSPWGVPCVMEAIQPLPSEGSWPAAHPNLSLLSLGGLIPVPQVGFKLLGLEELGGLGAWSPVEGAGDIQMLEAGGREHRLCVLHTELRVCPSHREPCDLSRHLKPFLHPMRPITPPASEQSRDQDEHGGSCPGTWHTDCTADEGDSARSSWFPEGKCPERRAGLSLGGSLSGRRGRGPDTSLLL